MRGLLRRLVEAGQQLTDAPDTYIIAVSYWVLSSTLGKYIVVPYYPRPPDNPMRPNLWIIISGLPGIMRKSTVIDTLGKNVVKNAWREYYTLANPRLTPEQVNEMVSKMFIETGSYEGIAKHISEQQRERDTFFIVSTEWGGILLTMRSRDYMIGFASLLSKLWAGEEHRVHLTREVRYIRSGLYVTALLGMQEPWLYMDKFVFRQGLMRRILLVYAEPSDKTRWLPPIDMGRLAVMDTLQDIAVEIAQRMDIYSQAYPVEARISNEAREMIVDYARRCEEEVLRNSSGNWSLYVQNLWDMLLRLSVLSAASRTERPRETGAGYVLYVETGDVEEAKRFLETTLDRARQAISLAGVPVREQEVVVTESAEETVMAVLKRHGCMKKTELLRATGMSRGTIKEIILGLVEKEAVKAFIKKQGRGRPAIIICTREDSREALIRGFDELSPEGLETLW